MTSTVLGIDLGKRWFHVVGRDQAGQITVRSKFNRAQLIQFIVNHPACLIGMETCCGSQHFARKFQAMGHDVKLLPAQYVRPFVKSQKNDFNDALAISEAVVMPTMRFVPVRSVEQMDVQALHRARDRMLQQRLALTNQIRGLLLDRGIEIAQGYYALRTVVPGLLADDQGELTPMMRDVGRVLVQTWQVTEAAIEELNIRIQSLARSSELCVRLQSIPGVGPLLATALVAGVGNASAFKRSRDLSGGRRQLASPRGDNYPVRLEAGEFC